MKKKIMMFLCSIFAIANVSAQDAERQLEAPIVQPQKVMQGKSISKVNLEYQKAPTSIVKEVNPEVKGISNKRSLNKQDYVVKLKEQPQPKEAKLQIINKKSDQAAEASIKSERTQLRAKVQERSRQLEVTPTKKVELQMNEQN